MRIRETTRFPHPVLSPYTDDYEQGSIELEFDRVVDVPAEGSVELSGIFTLDGKGLKDLLASGKAVSGLMVTGRDTYYDEWHPAQPGKYDLTIRNGRLRGAVYVQAMVVAAMDLILPESGLAQGFSGYALNIRSGSPLAVSEEHQLEIGFDKLVAMESIFSLIPRESLPGSEFMVNTDAETIEIHAGKELFADIQRIRGTVARDILLSGLYVPVLMEALDVMRQGSFADNRWHRVLRAKCNSLGYIVEEGTDNLVHIAQRLLKSPYGLLGKVLENNE